MRPIGALIWGTFSVIYRSSDGTSMGCLTAPAIVKFARWSGKGSRREEREHFEEELCRQSPKQ